MAFSRTLMLSLLVLFSFSEAREFEIDGKKNSWVVPSSPDEFNKWASRNRFQIGDSIVLEYDGKTDSVLEVNQEDYKTCNTSNPIKSYNDGNTKIVLDRSGAFFFISGAKGHCEKGQKLEIEVLSAKHSEHGHYAPSPAPSLAESHHHHAPAPAPSHGGDGMRIGFTAAAAAVVVGFLALV